MFDSITPLLKRCSQDDTVEQLLNTTFISEIIKRAPNKMADILQTTIWKDKFIEKKYWLLKEKK